MPKIKLLYVVWILVCIVLVLLTFNYQGETTQFYGIAETQEITISAESAVSIKKIQVVPGQTVAQGELIAELQNPDLIKSINETTHQLDEIRAQIASRTSEIQYATKQLEAQSSINKKLIAGLESLEQVPPGGSPAPADTPIDIRIQGLRQALMLEMQPLQIRIGMLEQELSQLLAKKNSLYIFAQVSGIIGSVRCKENEQIAPFQTIMTLHTKSPYYIRGYVHEFVYTRIAVGQKVKVISLADPAYNLTGEVVGVDSQIIEYPARLKRMLSLQVYGREVRIKIPENNNLLFGEKVMIQALGNDEASISHFFDNSVSFAKTPAAHGSKTADNEKDISSVRDVTVGRSLKDGAALELSGAVFLKNLKKYLVVSDTTLRERPVLYLMDEKGVVDDEIVIPGLQKIDDMESVTEDTQGRLYIACSQSSTTHGPPAQQRRLLVRLVRDGIVLRLDGTLSLYDVLSTAADADPEAEWVRFLKPKKKHHVMEMNIEGIMYLSGDMYLGFKKPLHGNKAVILKIKDIDHAFHGGLLRDNSVELWKEFDLSDNATGRPSGISDLCFLGNSVYILGCEKKQGETESVRASSLWRYDMASDRLSRLARFENLKAEGLAWNPDKNEFVIVCDQGPNAPSKTFSFSSGVGK